MVVAPPDGFASPRPKLSSFVPDTSAQMWFEGECFRLFLNDCHSQISMQCQTVISSSKLFSLMWISAFVGPNWIPPPSLYVVLMCFLFLYRCFLYICFCASRVFCVIELAPMHFTSKPSAPPWAFRFPVDWETNWWNYKAEKYVLDFSQFFAGRPLLNAFPLSLENTFENLLTHFASHQTDFVFCIKRRNSFKLFFLL